MTVMMTAEIGAAQIPMIRKTKAWTEQYAKRIADSTSITNGTKKMKKTPMGMHNGIIRQKQHSLFILASFKNTSKKSL